MRDRGLNIFLLFSFGITGMAMLVMAWIQPMTASERIMTTLAGSVGIFLALSLVLSLRRLQPETDSEHGPVEVEVEEKS